MRSNLKWKLRMRSITGEILKEHFGFTILITVLLVFLAILWKQYTVDIVNLGEIAFIAKYITLGVGILIAAYLYVTLSMLLRITKGEIRYDTVKVCSKHYKCRKILGRVKIEVYGINTNSNYIHEGNIKVNKSTFMMMDIGSNIRIAAVEGTDLCCANCWYVFSIN